MNWKELLKYEIEEKYRITEELFNFVNDSELSWKPSTGSNWMTAGQLINHIATDGCGAAIKGFVTGDWGMPDDAPPLSPEDMLPPAEKYATAESIERAKRQLMDDKLLSLEMLNKCSEKELSEKMLSAPWDPSIKSLGHWLLGMVEHFNQHKGQLYYYLKLQGKPVNTGNLYGVH